MLADDRDYRKEKHFLKSTSRLTDSLPLHLMEAFNRERMKSKLISGGAGGRGGGGGRPLKSSSSDQETKAWREAQEQRHLEAYAGMLRLRDALRRRYAALLRDKVATQRSLLRRRDEEASAKSQGPPEKKQKKLAFSKLQHSDSYLKALPKTSYYLIFDLQRQLAGHLKCHHDFEEFHGSIKYNSHPTELQRSLQDVRKNMLQRRCGTDVTQQKRTEKISSTADDRGSKNDTSQSRLLKLGSGPGQRAEEPIFDRGQEKDETEQMFLKMKAPTFATLQPKFMSNFQSKLPDSTIPEIPEKSRKAEIYMKRLREMYDLSLTNMAFTQRLLDRDTDSLCWQRERGVQGLVLPAIEIKKVKGRCISQLPVSSLKQPEMLQSRIPSRTQSRVGKTSASLQCSEVLEAKVSCRKVPDPLTIEDVCQQKHVKIIDCGPALWTNYAENTPG